MAFSSGIWSAKRWADMDEESESELWLSSSMAPKKMPSNRGDIESDETRAMRMSSLAPFDCGCHDFSEALVLAELVQTPIKQKTFPILATAPDKKQQTELSATTMIKRQESQGLHPTRSNGLSGTSRQYNDQRVTPAAVFHPRKIQNRLITSEELAQSRGSLDSGPQSVTIEPTSKQPQRNNKPSKNRRDRYRNIVENLQQVLDADPTIDIASILPSLPSFISSDEKLKEKLKARLQRHRQKQKPKLDNVLEPTIDVAGILPSLPFAWQERLNDLCADKVNIENIVRLCARYQQASSALFCACSHGGTGH